MSFAVALMSVLAGTGSLVWTAVLRGKASGKTRLLLAFLGATGAVLGISVLVYQASH